MSTKCARVWVGNPVFPVQRIDRSSSSFNHVGSTCLVVAWSTLGSLSPLDLDWRDTVTRLRLLCGDPCATRLFPEQKTVVFGLLSFLFLTMEHSKEAQRVEVRTCFALGMRQCGILRHLQAVHGQAALSSSSVNRWVCALRNGRRDLSTPKPTGRPTKLTQEVLRNIQASVREEPNSSLRQIAEEHSLGVATVHKALTKVLHMKKRPCVWRPHDLNQQQCRKRVVQAHKLLRMFTRSPTLPSRMITMDESWFWAYQPMTKKQGATWLEVGEARHSKVRQERALKKVMLTVFWDAQGIIHYEFLPQGRGGINAQYYLSVLRRFREAVRRKRRNLWRNRAHQF